MFILYNKILTWYTYSVDDSNISFFISTHGEISILILFLFYLKRFILIQYNLRKIKKNSLGSNIHGLIKRVLYQKFLI